jgi:transcriptional/translational regulatory protein YebC/TACO1
MGRAAAVRAATKTKTDAKKAKINAVFGKRIIMAVKSGGSPDPVANRFLADVIKQAKANSVPVEVSFLRAAGAKQINEIRKTNNNNNKLHG